MRPKRETTLDSLGLHAQGGGQSCTNRATSAQQAPPAQMSTAAGPPLLQQDLKVGEPGAAVAVQIGQAAARAG